MLDKEDIQRLRTNIHDDALQADKADNTDKYFKGQQNNEELICFFRRHWTSLVTTLSLFIAFVGLILGVFIVFIISVEFREAFPAYKVVFLIVFILSTIYLHRFFLRLVNHFCHVFIVTNNRIVEVNKTVYLHSTQDAIDLRLIEDVSKRQLGLMKNILNYGEVIITLSDFSKEIFWVPNPDFHFRVISRAMQSAKSGQPLKLNKREKN